MSLKDMVEAIRAIMGGGIPKSLAAKGFILNLIPEIAAMKITNDYFKPLFYVYHSVFLCILCYMVEKNVHQKNGE